MAYLYCDCFSGISGDMFLGALLDAGLPLDVLDRQFRALGLPEYQSVAVEKVARGAIQASLLKLDFTASPSDHHHHHHHHHRHLSDITAMIEKSALPDAVKETSSAIFHTLAEAEAAVHGTGIDEVHFHEVGAVDSILDIVGAAVGLHYFNIEQVYASALPLGSGQVKTEHGLLPVPAPATLALMQRANAPVVPSDSRAELITPTGAAILAALACFEQPAMILRQVGSGAGRRELPWANIMRVMIGEPGTTQDSSYLEIETNIDDMSPEVLGHVMGLLFQAGALDVFFTPIYMKKNRPAVKLSVICRREQEHDMASLLLRETSTLGARVRPAWRHEAQREMRLVATPYGEVPMKLKILDGQIVMAAPEFDVCARLAAEAGVPLTNVMEAALIATQKK